MNKYKIALDCMTFCQFELDASFAKHYIETNYPKLTDDEQQQVLEVLYEYILDNMSFDDIFELAVQEANKLDPKRRHLFDVWRN